MKRNLFCIVAALFLVFGTVGSAAAFATGDLVLVIYNETDNEIAINLGDVSEIDMTAVTKVLANEAFSLADFSAITSLSDLSAGIFAFETGYGSNWFATTSDTDSGVSGSSLLSFGSAASNLYNAFGTGDFFQGSSSAKTSYDWIMNSASTTPGYYAGFNLDYTVGEANLVDDGYVDLYLYNYDVITLDPGDSADYQAIIRIHSNGDVVLNPVPVPASILLMGSGLLGLIGIRRRNQ